MAATVDFWQARSSQCQPDHQRATQAAFACGLGGMPLSFINCRMKRKFTGNTVVSNFPQKRIDTLNVRNKWIKKENWLIKIGFKNIWTWNCNLLPVCKWKMVMPLQNYNFVCFCIQILRWHCNECHQITQCDQAKFL